MKCRSIVSLLVATLVLQAQALEGNPRFQGLDLSSGKEVRFEPRKDSKGTAVIFLSSKCGCTRLHMSYIKQLVKDFPDFEFVGINSNTDEDVAESQKYFSTEALGFPIVRDIQTQIANKFGALKTPHAFVIDPKGQQVFAGGVTSSSNPKDAEKFFLKETLAALRDGKKPPLAVARAVGCEIKR